MSIWYKVSQWSKFPEKINVIKETKKDLFVEETLAGMTLVGTIAKKGLYSRCFNNKKDAARWLITYLTMEQKRHFQKYNEYTQRINKLKNNYGL